MKKIYFVLVAAALMMFGTPAKAQLGFGDKLSDLVEVTYSPSVLNVNVMGLDLKYSMPTFGVTFYEVRSLHSTLPLYFQYGFGFQYSKADIESFGDDIKLVTSTIPISVMYELQVPSTNLLLYPYAGINLIDHIVGKSDGQDIFDDDFMEGDSMGRFCMGWQIGARLVHDRYSFSFCYEGPLTGLYNEDGMKIGISQYNISLGISF